MPPQLPTRLILRLPALLLGLGLLAIPAPAAVTFAGLFQNNMVLQRDLPLRVWGQAANGAAITVTLRHNGNPVRTGQATATASGSWLVTLDPVTDTTGTYSLEATGDGSATVSNLLLGEVWLCSGQSNANMSLLDHSGAITFLPGDAGIRHFDVSKRTSATPDESVIGNWAIPSASTSGEITAMGFFYARALRAAYPDVPVGIIRSSWGDTFIESWMSPAANGSRPDFRRRADALEGDAAERRRPSRPYHAMIHPLRHATFRGVLWYQGENNTGFPALYRDQLATLVETWRTAFGRPDLPFYAVQLTGIGRVSAGGAPDTWPALREAQAAIRQLPGTGVAITIDIGTETTEIHPPNKEEIGRRLSLLVRRDIHGEALVAEGPLYAGFAVEGGTVRIHFDTAGAAMISRDGAPLTGFEMAGADGTYHPAEAVIDGSSVTLTSTAAPTPIAARYAWSNLGTGNLSAATDPPLPAEPFRTPFEKPAVAHSSDGLEARWMADLFGVTHAGGKYSIPTRPEGVDYLNEGADRIVDLGSRTLKLWFNADPRSAYPNFDGRPEFDWPSVGLSHAVNSLAKLAALPFYRAAFERPEISTYYLVTTEVARITWRDGLTTQEEETVATEFRDAALHLIDTYADTGKTFIIQNWEGDNLLRLAQFDPSTWDDMAEGMIAYFKARQRGVSEARAARPGADVQVWNCIEINFNPAVINPADLNIPEEWTLVNRVVRDGYAQRGLFADLYSWSSWSGKVPGEEWRMLRGIDYLRSRVPTVGPLAPHNVVIGEFGAYENSFMPNGVRVHTAESAAVYSTLVANLFDYAWRGGARHAVFWSMYSSGPRTGVTFNPAAPVSLTQQEVVGAWLIRPPGPPDEPAHTFTPAYFHFADMARSRLLQDELTSFSRVHARSAGWASSAVPQSWAPGVRSRVYRLSNATPEWLVYASEHPIADVNITAFMYGNDISAERFRAALSPDGVTWSEPFALIEVDVRAADPEVTTWKRALLRLPERPAPTMRYLRLEIFGDSANWAYQLGGVTLLTKPPPPPPTTLAARQWSVVGEALTLSGTAPEGPGPFTYEWWLDDQRIAVTSSPELTLAGNPEVAGTYSVIARSPAGPSQPASVDLRLVTSWTGDDDGDGIPNLLAYARGGDLAPPGPPLVLDTNGTVSWTLHFAYDPAAPVRLTLESSADLTIWEERARREPGGPWTGTTQVSTTPLDYGLMQAEVAIEPTGLLEFHRLRAELP